MENKGRGKEGVEREGGRGGERRGEGEGGEEGEGGKEGVGVGRRNN